MKPYYQDKYCTLYNGDCFEVLPELDSVDLVLTDPPYVHKSVSGAGIARLMKVFDEGTIKELSDFDFNKFIPAVFEKCKYLIAFHSRGLVPDYAMFARSKNANYDLHFWHKTNSVPFCASSFKPDVEYIAHIWKEKPGWGRLAQHHYTKVFSSILMVNKIHPCEKPIDLLYRYLKILVPKTTLDPFAGSGTTLRAAKNLNRKAIGIEIEEKYCEIAARRLEQEVLDFGENQDGALETAEGRGTACNSGRDAMPLTLWNENQ